MTARRLIALTATAALAVPAASATADTAKLRVTEQPWLVETSNGAYVDYDLNRDAKSQVVTVDGKRAKVKTIKDDGGAFYRAFVIRPSLERGHRYTVTIRAKAGKDELSVRKSLVLNKSTAPRP